MARERLWIAGVDVSTWAIRAIDLSGILAVPERSGENTPVAGRHGTVRVPYKKYGGREMPMEFWVRGSKADGLVPDDPADQFYANLHVLGQILAQSTVPMRHQLPDGTVREIEVEVIAAVGPERWKTGDVAKVGVSFVSTSAFWQSITVTTAPMTLTNGGLYTLAEFADSDSDVDDVVLTIGQATGPKLFDTRTDGLWLAYDAVIGAGQTLVIDCGAKKLSGTGGLVPDRTKLRVHPQDGRWFSVLPVVNGAAQVRCEHGGGSGTVSWLLAGRQSWLFG